MSGTGLTDFSLAVENEKWYGMSGNPQVSLAKLVAVDVYGSALILRRNEAKMVRYFTNIDISERTKIELMCT